MAQARDIDELYQLPQGEFVGARNALSKTLSGSDAAHVKALPKPTVVPWGINQLYWRDRNTYDRVMKTGEAVREAQIAALKGRAADIRRASEAHRSAIAEAVRSATSLAAEHGSRPSPEPLARMLEALSLSANKPDPPGRLTELVQPSGFEALAGITPVARPVTAARAKRAVEKAAPAPAIREVDLEAIRAAEKRRLAEEQKRAKQAAAAEAKARKQVEAAEREVERIRRQLEAAEEKLRQMRQASRPRGQA